VTSVTFFSAAALSFNAYYVTTIGTTGGDGEDINRWQGVGVPGASLLNDNAKYFWYHHSNGDTMEVLNTDEVDRCAAVWAVHAYTVANLDGLLPR
jgi:carboxypeptidase Q